MRSNSTPILICVLDYAFLGRELPSRWSALCIVGMILGTQPCQQPPRLKMAAMIMPTTPSPQLFSSLSPFPPLLPVPACACVFAGGAGYAATDSSFVMRGYAWLGGWAAAFLFDQIYIKHVVESVEVR